MAGIHGWISQKKHGIMVLMTPGCVIVDQNAIVVSAILILVLYLIFIVHLLIIHEIHILNQ